MNNIFIDSVREKINRGMFLLVMNHFQKSYAEEKKKACTSGIDSVREIEKADALVQLTKMLEDEKMRKKPMDVNNKYKYNPKEQVFQKYDLKEGKTTVKVGLFNGMPKLRLSNISSSNNNKNEVTATEFTNAISDVVDSQTIYLNNSQTQSLSAQFQKIILCHKNEIHQTLRLGEFVSESDKSAFEVFGIDWRPKLVIEPGKDTVINTFNYYACSGGNHTVQGVLPDVTLVLNTMDLNALAD